MSLVTDLTIGLCLSALALGTLLVWRSLWNIPALTQIGFLASALIPLFFLGVTEKYPDEVVGLYTRILVLGTVAFLIGILGAAYLTRKRRLRPLKLSFNSLPDPLFTALTIRRTLFVMILALVVFLACFGAMGFVPLLADNPEQAKFFRGPYFDSYQRVAAPYRMSFYTLATGVTIALAAWYVSRKKVLLAISGVALLGLVATLSRGQAFFGLLMFAGLFLAYRKKWVLFGLLIVLAFPLGASVNYLFGVVTGGDIFALLTRTPLEALSVPDVGDSLLFIQEFQTRGEFTAGRTFWGGLVPYHYEWNPAVWTLSIISPGTPVRDVLSGGLRLPVPVWGYTAFGWVGVAAVSAMSGFFAGVAARLASRHVGRLPLLQSAVALTLYITLGDQIVNFFTLSLYNFPGILVAIYFSFRLATPDSADLTEEATTSWKPSTIGFW